MNRNPVLHVQAGHAFRIVEGGPALKIELAVSDPDEDRLQLSVENASEPLRVELRTGESVLRVSAGDRPGAQAGDLSVTVVAEDGHGGRAEREIAIRLEDVDHPSKIDIRVEPPWLLKRSDRKDSLVFFGPESERLTATILVSDVDRPDGEGLSGELKVDARSGNLGLKLTREC